jgi:hypothetical protein
MQAKETVDVMSTIEVKLLGEWKDVKRTFTLLPTFAKKLRENVADAIANRYYEELVGHFKNQDLPLRPLNEWYRQWKEKKGLDTRILIASGEMMGAIQLYNRGPGERFVGIKGGKKHRRSGLDVAFLALIHEYGTGRGSMQARPVYRLTLEGLRQHLGGVLQKVSDETRIEVFGR